MPWLCPGVSAPLPPLIAYTPGQPSDPASARFVVVVSAETTSATVPASHVMALPQNAVNELLDYAHELTTDDDRTAQRQGSRASRPAKVEIARGEYVTFKNLKPGWLRTHGNTN